MINQGSQTYTYANAGAIAVGAAIVWVDLEQQFPRCRMFLPLDSLEFINNSGAMIRLYLNSMTEFMDIPGFIIKPLNRRPLRRVGIENIDALVDIAIGEIIAHFRRLPQQVTTIVNVGG